VLALLVGIVGTTVLGTAAGARRTSTALDRFRREALAADVELAVVGGASSEDLDALRMLPDVAGVGSLRAYGLVIPQLRSLEAIGVPVDDQFGASVDRARVTVGREVDPDEVDEITVGEALAHQLGLGVGATLEADSYSPEQTRAVLAGVSDIGQLAGPHLELHVVGITRRPLDLSDRASAGGFLVLSPAFARVHGADVGSYGSYVRIRSAVGAAGFPAIVDGARRIFGDDLTDGRGLANAQGLAIETEGARDAVHLLALSTWIATGVGAAAGLVVLSLVLGREAALLAVDDPMLATLGLTRRQRALRRAPPVMLVALCGSAIAAVGAVAASPLFPVGVARRADPDVGFHVDAVVLGVGTLVLLAAVLATTALGTWRVHAAQAARHAVAPPRRSWPGDVSARLSRAPSMSTGARMALERGRGGRAVPIRAALLGVVLSVAGVCAGLVFVTNLDDLAGTASRYGAPWDVAVADLTANEPCGADDHGLHDDPAIEAAAEVCSIDLEVEGHSVRATSFRAISGDPIEPTVVEGRAPVSAHEVGLGVQPLRALHRRIGDVVEVRRGTRMERLTIVGTVVLPTLGAHRSPWLTAPRSPPRGSRRSTTRACSRVASPPSFRPGASIADLAFRLAPSSELGRPSAPRPPVEVQRVRQVRAFPLALGALVAVLGLAAVAHALLTGVRRRRRELALLVALGFTRRQVRGAVAWQASTLAAVGLLVGAEIGPRQCAEHAPVRRQQPAQARGAAPQLRELGQVLVVDLAGQQRDLEPVHRLLEIRHRVQVAVHLPVEQRSGERLRTQAADPGLAALALEQFVEDLQRTAVQAEHEALAAGDREPATLELQLALALHRVDRDQEPFAEVLQQRRAVEPEQRVAAVLEAQLVDEALEAGAAVAVPVVLQVDPEQLVLAQRRRIDRILLEAAVLAVGVVQRYPQP
jgi:hypothetical protein